MKGWLKINAVLAMIALVVVSGSAFAARQSSTSSVTLVRLGDSTTRLATGDPVFGEQVTFTVQSSIDRPFVLNECRKDGVLVSSEVHGFFDGNMFGTTYSLGPTTMWQGGEADCVASLIDQSRQRTKVLATTGTYHVAAA